MHTFLIRVIISTHDNTSHVVSIGLRSSISPSFLELLVTKVNDRWFIHHGAVKSVYHRPPYKIYSSSRRGYLIDVTSAPLSRNLDKNDRESFLYWSTNVVESRSAKLGSRWCRIYLYLFQAQVSLLLRKNGHCRVARAKRKATRIWYHYACKPCRFLVPCVLNINIFDQKQEHKTKINRDFSLILICMNLV